MRAPLRILEKKNKQRNVTNKYQKQKPPTGPGSHGLGANGHGVGDETDPAVTKLNRDDATGHSLLTAAGINEKS